MSLALTIDTQGEETVLAALDRFVDLPREELLEGLGGLLESQHRRRIEEEHTTPAGRPFAPNQRGTTPLYDTGRNLRDAFAYAVSDPEVRLTNSFIGAALLHFGGVVVPKNAKALAFSVGGEAVFTKRVLIPARPFMGISADNQVEIVEAVEAFVEGLVQ
ncbi:phage gpG-like protein [Chelatococcus caeni]|uniref:Phage gpG-like protein n=1 Tax=Chelatococcus caeni TaxID=1348468 RepID=A0A840BZ48_9HYPH|nr:phage virion morphogenesis protein [Chelatococcus caeni]MBB4018230.1 phage gpG-like protein [Chelatococcus caeni]